jgi:hypothetical protein
MIRIPIRLIMATLFFLSLRQTSCQYVRLGLVLTASVMAALFNGLKSSLENCMRAPLLSNFDPGIDGAIDNIDQEIHQYDKRCKKDRQPHYDGVVPVGYAADVVPAKSGYIEDPFHHEAACKDGSD